MAGEALQGMRVAILVTDGFEQVELTEPRKALDRRSDRRKAQRGFPGLESASGQRLPLRDTAGLRGVAHASRYRPTRLLPAALAGAPTPPKDRRRGLCPSAGAQIPSGGAAHFFAPAPQV